MAHCVYSLDCKSTASIYFKGRFFCTDHARLIKERLTRIVTDVEKRVCKPIPKNQKIGINNPREFLDSNGKLVKLRGQHLTISKHELDTIFEGDLE